MTALVVVVRKRCLSSCDDIRWHVILRKLHHPEHRDDKYREHGRRVDPPGTTVGQRKWLNMCHYPVALLENGLDVAGRSRLIT